MTPRGTPTTTTRIPPDLKARAQARAAREGTTLTAVIVAALVKYVEGEGGTASAGTFMEQERAEQSAICVALGLDPGNVLSVKRVSPETVHVTFWDGIEDPANRRVEVHRYVEGDGDE